MRVSKTVPYKNSQIDLQRAEQLLKDDLVSREYYDNALTQRNRNRAALDGAIAQMQQANLNLSYTNINSPMNGRIGIEYNPAIQASFYNQDAYKSRIGQAWANYFPSINAGVELSRTGNRYNKEIPPYYKRSIYNTTGYVPSVSADSS